MAHKSLGVNLSSMRGPCGGASSSPVATDSPKFDDCNDGVTKECTTAYSPDLRVPFYVFYTQTARELDRHLHNVKHGEGLDSANDFARYILNSGVVKLLAPYDSSGTFKIDSAHLRWKAEEVRRLVCDSYQAGKAVPEGGSVHLAAISRKLDLIAGRLAQIPVASADQVPALHVVEGE